MAKIAFTDKEMEKACLRNISAYHKTPIPRTNAHRLLLFYAVECGLKVMFMKKSVVLPLISVHSKKSLNTDIHSINNMLDCIGANGNLRIPEIRIEDIPDKINNKKNKKEKRKLDSGQINQIWRYGGNIKRPVRKISLVSKKW
ncbi:hypothetical protein [Trichormus azollae]|jgi:hypothetical protein|uniref:Uncharacterized protein n=1 Tax=Nostoc azollae (strain 0708) TaxID=551115 RepID=D7DYE2_NOSA0|nr:hypothetical protein [Trichormus azollae]ADI66020.1 conserved hypothetical protein ['Nostoc azollae' 0708]